MTAQVIPFPRRKSGGSDAIPPSLTDAGECWSWLSPDIAQMPSWERLALARRLIEATHAKVKCEVEGLLYVDLHVPLAVAAYLVAEAERTAPRPA